MAINPVYNQTNTTRAVLDATNSRSLVSPAEGESFKSALESAVKDVTAGQMAQTAPRAVTLDSLFSAASKTYNVPTSLLKAIAKAESNFNPKAVSSAGAQGIMQLMPATSRSMNVSDPFDAKQSIMAGAKLIGGLIDKYDGNTKLALAAYNAGSGNVAKYGGIPPFTETQNYVKKVMKYYASGVEVDPARNIYELNDADLEAYGLGAAGEQNGDINAMVSSAVDGVIGGNTAATDLLLLQILQMQLEAENDRNDFSDDMIF